MCTINNDDEKIFEALKAGASGYLLKQSAIAEIYDAIENMLLGGSPMSPVIARKVVQSFSKTTTQPAANTILTPRENQVLELLAQGKKIKDIADLQFVSVNTIKSQIHNIYEKLQVKTRIEAINILKK
jgi:DNA-binding NarL/FixJ family response regulator